MKWTGDRSESFLTDAHGRDHVSKAEMAFDKDNKILGLRVKTYANFGAYMSLFSSAVPTRRTPGMSANRGVAYSSSVCS